MFRTPQERLNSFLTPYVFFIDEFNLTFEVQGSGNMVLQLTYCRHKVCQFKSGLKGILYRVKKKNVCIPKALLVVKWLFQEGVAHNKCGVMPMSLVAPI